jgi:hypothetical protein
MAQDCAPGDCLSSRLSVLRTQETNDNIETNLLQTACAVAMKVVCLRKKRFSRAFPFHRNHRDLAQLFTLQIPPGIPSLSSEIHIHLYH